MPRFAAMMPPSLWRLKPPFRNSGFSRRMAGGRPPAIAKNMEVTVPRTHGGQGTALYGG